MLHNLTKDKRKERETKQNKKENEGSMRMTMGILQHNIKMEK